jgi:predicted RNase H-like HicB family nuclease
MRALRVDAAWDDDASVWVATSDDIPGLVTEAETLDELRAKLVDLVPELLAENGDRADRSTALPIEIVATRHLFFDAA